MRSKVLVCSRTQCVHGEYVTLKGAHTWATRRHWLPLCICQCACPNTRVELTLKSFESSSINIIQCRCSCTPHSFFFTLLCLSFYLFRTLYVSFWCWWCSFFVFSVRILHLPQKWNTCVWSFVEFETRISKCARCNKLVLCDVYKYESEEKKKMRHMNAWYC